MSQSYEPVSTSESDEERKKQNSVIAEKIATKVHALFWVLSAFGVVYWSDFVKVALESHKIDR